MTPNILHNQYTNGGVCVSTKIHISGFGFKPYRRNIDFIILLRFNVIKKINQMEVERWTFI